MPFTGAYSEVHIPAAWQYDPDVLVFLDAGGENILACFEMPEQPDMGKDPITPS